MPGLTIPEIIEMVIDQLYDDKATLASCSTVSKVWVARSRYYLFRTIQLIIRTSDRNLDAAAAFFNTTPSVCGYVQHIHIRAAETMKLPVLGMDEFAGVWPIPQSGTDLRQMCSLLRSLTNPVSVDLEGVYIALDLGMLVGNMEVLKSPSLRKLTMREVLIPPPAFPCFFNLTNIFTGLEDLSLVNMLFDNSEGLDDLPPWGGDLKISTLMLRSAQGLLSLLPSTAFRNLRQLNMPMLSLLIPDAARFLIPLYNTVEEMTLGAFLYLYQLISHSDFKVY